MYKIAIIYASRYGATKEIAEKMEENAQAADVDVSLVDVKNTFKLDLTAFDGVVVGGGIQIGKIPSSLRKFLKKKRAVLNLFKNNFGVFLVCGTAKDPAGVETAKEKYLTPLLTKYDLKPGTTAVFGGVFDLRLNSRFGKLKSGLIRKMLAEEGPKKYDLNGMNDFRDWATINRWFEAYLSNFTGFIRKQSPDPDEIKGASKN
ncbi:MAG: hypothetical protein DRO88_14335 [Promethearchaeia archaeon]|nr:MAG: hypothetical protein DRO88_14335 [Candidatus Lokiarchaeia archaeon]